MATVGSGRNPAGLAFKRDASTAAPARPRAHPGEPGRADLVGSTFPPEATEAFAHGALTTLSSA